MTTMTVIMVMEGNKEVDKLEEGGKKEVEENLDGRTHRRKSSY